MAPQGATVCVRAGSAPTGLLLGRRRNHRLLVKHRAPLVSLLGPDRGTQCRTRNRLARHRAFAGPFVAVNGRISVHPQDLAVRDVPGLDLHVLGHRIPPLQEIGHRHKAHHGIDRPAIHGDVFFECGRVSFCKCRADRPLVRDDRLFGLRTLRRYIGRSAGNHGARHEHSKQLHHSLLGLRSRSRPDG